MISIIIISPSSISFSIIHLQHTSPSYISIIHQTSPSYISLIHLSPSYISISIIHLILLLPLLRLLTLPQTRTYIPGTYKPNARGSNACRGSNNPWNRTLDRYTRAGLPECVVSTMSGPQPKTTQVRTQRTHTQSQDRN